MIIRRATLEDAEAICEIWNHIIRDTLATFTTDEKVPEGLGLPDAPFFVAEDGEVLGFGTYFPFRGGVGYAHTKEHSIHLLPQARGRGAGRALMVALEEDARAQGVHSLWAGISGANPGGVAFHEAMGFTHIARLPEVGRKWDQWLDLVLMQKILD